MALCLRHPQVKGGTVYCGLKSVEVSGRLQHRAARKRVMAEEKELMVREANREPSFFPFLFHPVNFNSFKGVQSTLNMNFLFSVNP